jgi:hypothetical protein
MLRPISLAQKRIPIFRRLVFVVLSAILLSSTPSFTSPAFATNCSAVTGGSISDIGDDWLLQWDALPNTANISYLIIFATSGVDSQIWYNNASGYQWSDVFSPTSTSYTISKSSLITFANSNNVQNMTFSLRKDNNNAMCYPLTTLGAISLAAAPAAPTLNSVTSGDRRVTISFTAGANNGAAITDYEYSLNGGAYTSAGTTTSPFTITGLSGRTAYSVTIKARNSVGLSTASSSLSATTTDASLLAAEAEAARRANEQRQMGDISSVLPLINELIKEIEDGLKSTSAPKKKSSTSKTKQSSQAKPEKKTNSEPLTIPIPPATEPEAQSQVRELVTVSHKVGFGLSASWINSSNIKELRGFIAGVEESFEVERIVIQGYAQPTKIGLPDIDIARAKAVKKLLIKDGLDYPIVVEGMGQAESKKSDLSRIAVVTVEGKIKNQN